MRGGPTLAIMGVALFVGLRLTCRKLGGSGMSRRIIVEEIIAGRTLIWRNRSKGQRALSMKARGTLSASSGVG